MQTTIRKQLFFLVKVCISGGLLGYLLYKTPIPMIIHTIQSANLWLIFAFVPILVLTNLIAALQFKIFTDCHRLPLSLLKIVEVNLITNFYTLFLPGYLSGGAIRWYKLSKDNKKGAEVLAAIVFNRWIHISILVGTGCLGWLLEPTKPTRTLGLLLLLPFFLLVFAFVLMHSTSLLTWLESKIQKSIRFSGFIQEKSLKLVIAAKEYQYLTFLDHCMIIGYLTLWHFLTAGSSYLFCLALQIQISFWTLLWIRGIITFAMMLPISIAGFGVREGGLVYFLGLYGIKPASGFALSMLILLQHLVVGAIGGLIELHYFLSKDKALLRES